MDTFNFEDAKGRVWDVTLTLLACQRVDKSDFTELTDKKFTILEPTRELFMDVLTDTPLLFAIVWAIVQPQVKDNLGIDVDAGDANEQAEALALAEAEFLSGINGQTVQAGREAVWRSVAAFFPEHQTVLLNLMKQYQRSHIKIADELAKMTPEMEAMMDAEINRGMMNLRENLELELGKKSTA